MQKYATAKAVGLKFFQPDRFYFSFFAIVFKSRTKIHSSSAPLFRPAALSKSLSAEIFGIRMPVLW